MDIRKSALDVNAPRAQQSILPGLMPGQSHPGLAVGRDVQTLASPIRIHIAFVVPAVKEKILSGVKTCESRLSVHRHPARTATAGDTLLFKCRTGFAVAPVVSVDIYQDLTPSDMIALQDLYLESVSGPKPNLSYWESKRGSHHAVFLHFRSVTRVDIPVLPVNMSGWISDYEPPQDVLSAIASALHKS